MNVYIFQDVSSIPSVGFVTESVCDFVVQESHAEAQDEAAISDDELPPGVDLSDPFFSEELGGSAGKSNGFLFLPSLGLGCVRGRLSVFRVPCRRVVFMNPMPRVKQGRPRKSRNRRKTKRGRSS